MIRSGLNSRAICEVRFLISFMSTILNPLGLAAAGKHDRAKPNSANSPHSSPASLAASVTSGSDGDDSALFHGYHFRVLSTRQGAVLIAYPAEYRSSGVMTFVATANGAIYEKDLGPDTPAVAKAMTAFHKDSTWRAAGD